MDPRCRIEDVMDPDIIPCDPSEETAELEAMDEMSGEPPVASSFWLSPPDRRTVIIAGAITGGLTSVIVLALIWAISSLLGYLS